MLYAALEALLHVCLEKNYMSVEKFSRWLRAICSILLARNTPADRVKAVGYVEQAVGVVEDNNDDGSENVSQKVFLWSCMSLTGQKMYPVDERQWLLSTSYNTGVECLS